MELTWGLRIIASAIFSGQGQKNVRIFERVTMWTLLNNRVIVAKDRFVRKAVLRSVQNAAPRAKGSFWESGLLKFADRECPVRA